MLLVGNPALPLKGFDVALAVLAAVGRLQRLEVTWVCQARAGVGCRVAAAGLGHPRRCWPRSAACSAWRSPGSARRARAGRV